MAYVKVQVTNNAGTVTVYRPLFPRWDVTSEVLRSLINNQEKVNMEMEEFLRKYRTYWIDEDLEKIDIADNLNWKIFYNNSQKKKLYVVLNELQEISESLVGVSRGSKTTKSDVHEGIECNECEKSPIIGFRYICVQCPDYDLCADCESKKKHSEHIMLRLPTVIQNVHLDRKFLKKMKRECSTNPEREDQRSQKQGNKQRTNIFSSFYNMMQDMAEGESDKIKKDKEKNKNLNCNRREFPVLSIDPLLFKAGVQILDNFSELFNKLLNPSVAVDKKVSKTNERNPKINRDTSGSKKNGDIKIPPAEGRQPTTVLKPMPGTSAPLKNKETAAQQEQEFDSWTFINPTSSSGGDSEANAAINERMCSRKSKEASPTADYVKVSKVSLEHMQKEEEEAKTTEKTKQPEMRAKIVFHKNQKINDAVHAMMAMGFCNEGNWLTQLMETVDGDISQAVDLLKPVK